MMHIDLAQYLGAQLAELDYSLTTGGTIFIDELPSSPDRAVAILTQGGTEADSQLPYDSPNVQIIVRSDTSPAWAIATCDAIYKLLHGKRNIVLAPGTTYLVYALFRQSSPNRIGTDDNGRQRYTMNLRTEVLNLTQERS